MAMSSTESVATMGLRYATVTGVARDDLPDQGVWLYAETVRAIHAADRGEDDICGAVRRAGDDGVSYRERQQQRCRGPAVQIWQ